jgi:radical SAM protein with 4Fe4S-binding SPASM domain
MRRSKLASKLKIGVSFLIQKENFIELADFVRVARGLNVDSIVIKHDIYGEQFTTAELEQISSDIAKLDGPNLEIREDLKYDFKSIKCFVPYFKVSMNPYGDLFSCCLGSQPGEINGYKLGSIKGDGNLETIWIKSKKIRTDIIKNGVSCKNCNYTDYKLNLIMGAKCQSI